MDYQSDRCSCTETWTARTLHERYFKLRHYRNILALYDEVGGFGMFLLTCGKDWGSHDQRERSMRLFMEEVAPRLALLPPEAALAA